MKSIANLQNKCCFIGDLEITIKSTGDLKKAEEYLKQSYEVS